MASPDHPTPRRAWRSATVAALVLALAVLAALAPAAWAPPGAPTGLTPFAGAGRVTLSWQPVAGAIGYRVVRGTSASKVDTELVLNQTGTTYTDTTATNGTTWYYLVQARDATGLSPISVVVSATPRAPSCSTGNAIVRENCFPGATGWKVQSAADPAHNGLEGFTTQSSIAAGDSVGIKVNGPKNASYRAEIWRTGWYGGNQGRLVGNVLGLKAVAQPVCPQNSQTGLVDCSGWGTAVTLTTTSAWPSGVYLIKLIRSDNSAANYVLLTVRDPSRTAELLFDVPVNTYQAYNNYGGRSLYSWNSWGNNTISGATRAVKVSFDRPYTQPITKQHDFYTQVDVQTVGWLERQGYDVSYADSTDVHQGAGLTGRKAIVVASHDEYQSQEMRSALTSARDGGVGIASLSANAMFWKARYEPSPTTGVADRTLVDYKTTESGPADPNGPTTTWRDPAGANKPENALFGGMFVGQNSSVSYPLYVTAAQGKHRVWRYTSLSTLSPGSRAQIGFKYVGWEWDRRVDNGQGPAGVEAVSSSPVNGDVLQDAGRVFAPGDEVSEATYYKAASGATVFSSGTNQWSRGLGKDVDNSGEPDTYIQQATANVLADMGARPTTASGVTLDAAGALQITARSPASGATAVKPDATVRVTFDRKLDPGSVRDDSITLKKSSGTSIAGKATYDDSAKAVTFTPDEPLDGFTTYNVTVGTGLTGWNGQGLASASTWSFTTGAGIPPAVTSRSPAAGATDVAFGATVRATFNRQLDAATVDGTTVKLSSSAGSVPARVTYDGATRTVTLTPDTRLGSATQYTARLTTGLKASDGTPMAADDTWSFTTVQAPEVTSQTPAPLSSGVSTHAVVRAVFSRALDPATLTPASFTLQGPSGTSASGAVTYDPATHTATFTPDSPLLPASSYTATLAASIRATDGTPLYDPVSWSFTTALTSTAAPAATELSPAAGATGVPTDSLVRATFDRALDPASVTTSSFTLTGPGGATVAASVRYDAATTSAILTPAAALALNTTYTARVASSVRSSKGEPLASDVVWTFTTRGCPCSTMATLAPQETHLSTVDGRTGAGPFSREVGVKLAVDETIRLSALKFYKSPGETGTHVGRIWTASGGAIASATFQNETASGWQQQDLASPVTLKPGRTYVASVGVNSYYVVTRDQLAGSLAFGPLHTVADGANGVYGEASGDFPTSSWRNSNYFVDAVVDYGSGQPQTPQVTSTSPLDGAAGVSPQTAVKATFSTALDPATVNSQSFTLRKSGGAAVSASVTYDEATRQARLTPAAPLDAGAVYVARLDTSVQAQDGTPLPADYSWQFSIADGSSPAVTATSPSQDATNISGSTDVRATFSQALDPSTVDTSSFKLTAPGGSTVPAGVSYDGATKTAVLTPSASLQASTVYTATLTTAIRSSTGTPLPAPYSWSFTTSACPCSLFSPGSSPAATHRPVRDGRPDPGPWSYEMGVKFRVTQPASLTAIKFYKSPGEGGTHVGRLWSASGSQIAQVNFSGESSSGWQQQALATPVALAAGQTYVASVGINDYYVVTTSGLASPVVNGPLESIADGANGVFGSVAGSFPTDSWSSSNYFIDPVVR